MAEYTTHTRSSASIWHYLSSGHAVRQRLLALPGFHSLQPGRALFHYTSTIDDRSVRVISQASEGHQGRYLYEVGIYYLRPEIIVLRGRWDLAEEIARNVFAHLAFVSVNIDIERLARSHAENVTRLYVRLRNDPSLKATALYGTDVLRSHLFKEIGAATYLGASLRNPFELVPETIISFGSRGTFSSEATLSDDQMLAIAERVLHGFASGTGMG